MIVASNWFKCSDIQFGSVGLFCETKEPKVILIFCTKNLMEMEALEMEALVMVALVHSFVIGFAEFHLHDPA